MPLSLMIKPASGGCNMRCRYCFYADEMKLRQVASYGFMTTDTLETVICKALETTEQDCTIIFQKGRTDSSRSVLL